MESNPEEFEQQLADCRAELNAALREAEENALMARAAQEELQYFVYAASHDLQQPLRAIGTYAQLLQREYPDDERAREFTTVIVEGAAQMNALIRDLLTYSRTGNTAQRACVNLNAPFQWALFNLAKAVQESGAHVTGKDLPEAFVDERQMVSVFENLIGNSIKYRGPEPLEVEVSSEAGTEYYTISVTDNGPGIKPEYKEKIFEPFKRLHTKEIPGSGLGLAICRKILRAHRGKIWVDENASGGSTFRFTIPL